MTASAPSAAVSAVFDRGTEASTLASTLVDASPPESALHGAAEASDARSTVEIGLAMLWRELSLGLCRVEAAFFTHERCFVLTRPTEGRVRPIPVRRLQVLTAVLEGRCQKSIAMELRVAPSTVALNARLSLDACGVGDRASRLHPLLMRAAIAAKTRDTRAVGKVSFIEVGGAQLRVVAMPRPDGALTPLLPAAQLAVARLLVEGASYEDIAARRRTSPRTVANQVAAAFRRLRVSGRSELLLRLFAGELIASEKGPSVDPCST